MPDRLLRPQVTQEKQRESDDQLPDISQIETARLRPRQAATESQAQQIAQHQAEVRRLVDRLAVGIGG